MLGLIFWSLFFFAIAIFSIGYFIRSIIYRKKADFIEKNSKVLGQIDLLNKKYSFYDIAENYTHEKNQKSLAAYRRMDYEFEFLEFVKEYKDSFERIIEWAKINTKIYTSYSKEFESVYMDKALRFDSRLEKKIEEELVIKRKKKPTCSFVVMIRNSYMSPKGQNFYSDFRVFYEEDVIRAFSKIKELQSYEQQKQRERSKMSESLRYDILKRDGFRCTICGASSRDGVKLHVDHIIPISKGGRSEEANLRTLCSRCNLGKKDKYDPKGLN